MNSMNIDFILKHMMVNPEKHLILSFLTNEKAKHNFVILPSSIPGEIKLSYHLDAEMLAELQSSLV